MGLTPSAQQASVHDEIPARFSRRREVSRFASRLKLLFRDEIAADPRAFKKEIVEILKRNLPPFAGRPTDECISLAVRLKAEGKTWSEIYPLVIADHAFLDASERRLAETDLRSKIRSRRNARRRRERSTYSRSLFVADAPIPARIEISRRTDSARSIGATASAQSHRPLGWKKVNPGLLE
jgi:hypothetical protein